MFIPSHNMNSTVVLSACVSLEANMTSIKTTEDAHAICESCCRGNRHT